MKTRNAQKMPSIGRRRAIIASAAVVVGAGAIEPAQALNPWWIALTAGLASNWMAKALENFGLVPGAVHGTVDPLVAQGHREERDKLLRQGLPVRPTYRGPYAEGDLEISEAGRGEVYGAIS